MHPVKLSDGIACKLNPLFLVVVISIGLASCGGGSGDTGDNGVVEETPQEETDSNSGMDMPEDPIPEDPIADNDESDDGQTENDESDDGQTDDDTDNGLADNDMDGDDDTSEPTDLPTLLFVNNGPAEGISGGRIDSFTVDTINAAGYGVFSAEISGAVSGSALWAAKPDGMELIWRTGDSLSSQSGAPLFSALIDSAVSSSGDLALVVSTMEGDRALVSITEEGQPEILLRSGDESVGPYDSVLDGPGIIETLLAVRRSTTDLYVLAEFAENRSDSVWLQRNSDGFEQVIRSASNFISSATSLSVALADDLECRLYTRSAANDSPGSSFYAIDDGSVVANGRRLCGQDSGSPEDVIVRRDITGNWSVVAAIGDGVPQAPESTFRTLVWHSVDEVTGDGIVAARVRTADGTFQGQDNDGWWSYPASGEARLLLLEGEEIQVGTEVVALPSARSFRTAPDVSARKGIAAVRFGNEVESNVQTVLARGAAHSVAQPHASLAVPGASSLTTLAATGLLGPSGQEVQSRFTSLSQPMLAANGDVWFTGTLANATIGGQSRSALWKADANGTISPVLSVGDSVFVSGVASSIVEFEGFFGESGLNPGFITDDGDIYLLVIVEGNFSGTAALLKMNVNNDM